MNRFSSLGVILLTGFLCNGRILAAFPEVENARHHGAEGQVTLRAVDSSGKPVDKAGLSVAFWGSDSLPDVIVSEGQTDTNGLFAATGTTIHSMNYEIKKDGYYSTKGQYWFLRKGEDCVRAHHWQPWNPTNTVVLKERRRPVAMYAKGMDEPIPVRDTPVGYDLEAGDWTAPHGNGKRPDLLLTYKATVQDHWNGSLELVIACPNRMEGFFRAQSDMSSDFRSAYEAPNSGYQPEVQFAFVTTTDKDLKVEKMGDSEYLAFRVRTVVDDKGNIVSAQYGKIYGPIEFGVGKEHRIRFSYYLNPTPNDRNLEFDPNRNLFTDLAPMEQVREP
jgi:hypothetical protein